MEEYSVKGLRKKFKEQGVFYTDQRLAKFIASFIPDGITEAYDPTCGSGNLLSVFPDDVKKYGQEIDATQAEEARHRLTNCEIAVGDTLEQPAFMDRKFKGIVANPPFSIKWQPPMLPDGRFSTAPVFPPPGKADYAFILHILYYLDDGGVASVLNFPGVLYRGNREYTLRKWIVERNLIDSVTLVDGGYFEDTTISTALIVFKKGRSDGDKIRFATFPDGKETTVSLDDVREQDYNLSPSAYIEDDTNDPFADFDPVAAELLARKHLVEKLRKELTFSRFVAEQEGLPLQPLLDELQEVINEFTK